MSANTREKVTIQLLFLQYMVRLSEGRRQRRKQGGTEEQEPSVHGARLLNGTFKKAHRSSRLDMLVAAMYC